MCSLWQTLHVLPHTITFIPPTIFSQDSTFIPTSLYNACIKLCVCYCLPTFPGFLAASSVKRPSHYKELIYTNTFTLIQNQTHSYETDSAFIINRPQHSLASLCGFHFCFSARWFISISTYCTLSLFLARSFALSSLSVTHKLLFDVHKIFLSFATP